MGLFGKKKKEEKKLGEDFKLPELPKLPDLPDLDEDVGYEKDHLGKPMKAMPQLPSFPSSTLGDKFSKDRIKEAITGKKEGEEVFGADEFPAPYDEEQEMMQEPLKKPLTKELEELGISKKTARARTEAGPVFIRIDKFQDSLNTFEKAKRQITEIEKLVSNIKKIKEHEEKEIEFWESELQKIKIQIEKVDRDIFSSLE